MVKWLCKVFRLSPAMGSSHYPEGSPEPSITLKNNLTKAIENAFDGDLDVVQQEDQSNPSELKIFILFKDDKLLNLSKEDEAFNPLDYIIQKVYKIVNLNLPSKGSLEKLQ